MALRWVAAVLCLLSFIIIISFIDVCCSRTVSSVHVVIVVRQDIVYYWLRNETGRVEFRLG